SHGARITSEPLGDAARQRASLTLPRMSRSRAVVARAGLLQLEQTPDGTSLASTLFLPRASAPLTLAVTFWAQLSGRRRRATNVKGEQRWKSSTSIATWARRTAFTAAEMT